MMMSLAACGSSAADSTPAASESTASSEAASGEAAPAESEAAADFDTDQDITVISREDGSGTRGAFIELTGVEEKNADGQKIDNTTEAAAIQSSTNGVMTAVANDETAIGYISLGSLNDSVKAVKVGLIGLLGIVIQPGQIAQVAVRLNGNGRLRNFRRVFVRQRSGRRCGRGCGGIHRPGSPAGRKAQRQQPGRQKHDASHRNSPFFRPVKKSPAAPIFQGRPGLAMRIKL